MQSKKYYLAFAVAGILCTSVGGIEEPRFIGGDLIALANPALAGIEQLRVLIAATGTDSNKVRLDYKRLEAEVERKLQDAGIRISVPKEGATSKFAASADLVVCIEVLTLTDLPQCVLRIQTSLARAVCLTQAGGLYFKADVWKTEPVIQAVSVQTMPGKVTDLVGKQVEAFICAYQVANAQSVSRDNTNGIAQQSKGQAQPADEPAATYAYVASKNSNVFHKPDCRWAKNISPKNLVGYSSRDEAIAAGKRPCNVCKP
jgi:hypothetical protein